MLRSVEKSKIAHGLLTAVTLAMCLGSAVAQETAATLVSMQGQVNVLRDSVPWALSAGSKILPKQMVVTGPDGMAHFQVSDGSTFDVFPNSRVVFRSNPPNWKDLLDVYLGRVRVHIQKLNGMPNHNRVTTPTAVISVRGTTFDVINEDADDTTLVSVEEGEVAVRNQLAGGEVILQSGDSIRVFKNQPLARAKVDRGNIAQGALKAAAQALYEVLYRRSVNGSSPSSGGTIPTTGGASGDHDKTGTSGGTAPPPPPSAPPPPPPPPPQQ
jgi:hypothetical protein